MTVKYAAHSITSGEWDFFETEAEALNWAEKEVLIELNDEGYSSDTCHGGIQIFKLIKESVFQEPICNSCLNPCNVFFKCVGRIEFKDVEE